LTSRKPRSSELCCRLKNETAFGRFFCFRASGWKNWGRSAHLLRQDEVT
jgi:hypothetical protein